MTNSKFQINNKFQKTKNQNKKSLGFGAWDLRFTSEDGLVALSFTVIAMFIAMAIIISFVFIFLNRLEAARNTGLAEEAYFAAESGIEDALLRFLDTSRSEAATSPYVISVGSASATVQLNDLPGSTKEFISDGEKNSRQRRVRTLMQVDADEANFFHGAQIGDGGLIMGQGSEVVGSVFSNGDIIGSNSPDITGDAFTAADSVIDGIDIGGNSHSRSIIDSTVAGEARASDTIDSTDVALDAYADIFDNGCTIGGDAYYNTSIDPGCTIAGSSVNTAAPSDLEPEDMPISDEKIDGWKQNALDGGLITTCDGSGEYYPADQETIGPAKIECDLVIDGNKTVYVGGYVWIEGDIIFQNQPLLKLDPSFGQLSSVIIADHPGNRGGRGVISIGNNASIEGSGEEGSYLMLVSRNNSAEGGGGGATAISIQNGSASSIFYAPHGKIEISNNVSLVEVTGYELVLSNSAVIEYEQGLASVQFTSGPRAGYSILSWEEE